MINPRKGFSERQTMLTESLDFSLPPQLIATEPSQPRDAARLMVIDRHSGSIHHTHVRNLPGLVSKPPTSMATPQPGDLLVFNQSRVIPAFFVATRSATGGSIRGLYLASPSQEDRCTWLVMLESRGKLNVGEKISLEQQSWLELEENRCHGQWLARLTSPDNTSILLNRIGKPPLPPYIRRQRRLLHQAEIQPQDTLAYNTVFAQDPGSIAAPTAGLHFTTDLLAQLEQVGIQHAVVTLHVGLGTFAPVRTQRLEDHEIHLEPMTVPTATMTAIEATRRAGGRVIPIGTTTVRALESLPDPPPTQGDFTTCTDLFITPDGSPSAGACGFSFRFTDALMTNFHLPKSTLLAMVAALPEVGLPRLKAWYQLAIDEAYRFYSYGDAMLIL